MIEWIKNGLFFHFLSLGILQLSLISFYSSENLAEDASSTLPEETHLVDTQSSNDEEINSIIVEEALATEAIWFGFGEKVTIATRHETPISKAPSIVTVITAEEIKNLGYRTFVEILRTVPGFEILKTGDFGLVIPAVRGLKSEFGNRVRVMLNGHMVNNPVPGEAFGLFDDFPVENIKRLEIIRGPGSAVYGENAFSAVINIITKDADDMNGVRVSSGYGSFDTHEENVLFGETLGSIKLYGMARYRHTDGFDGIVKSDAQTILDNTFGSSASQAPGRVHDGRQEYDLNLKVTYEDLWFQGWYINKNWEPFIGPNFALIDEADIESNYVFGEIGYKKTFDERFTPKPRIYYDQFDNNNASENFPEGTVLPADTNGDGIPDTLENHPDGLIAIIKGVQRIVGTESHLIMNCLMAILLPSVWNIV